MVDALYVDELRPQSLAYCVQLAVLPFKDTGGWRCALVVRVATVYRLFGLRGREDLLSGWSCGRGAATVVGAFDGPAGVVAGFGAAVLEEVAELVFLLFAAVALVDGLSTAFAGVVDDLVVVDLGAGPGVLRLLVDGVGLGMSRSGGGGGGTATGGAAGGVTSGWAPGCVTAGWASGCASCVSGRRFGAVRRGRRLRPASRSMSPTWTSMRRSRRNMSSRSFCTSSTVIGVVVRRCRRDIPV